MQNCKAKKSKDSCVRENEEKCQIKQQDPPESAPATRAGILLQPVKQKMVKKVVLMQPVKDSPEKISMLPLMEDPKQEQIFHQDVHPMGYPHWSYRKNCTSFLHLFLKNYSQLERSTLIQFMKCYSSWTRPTSQQQKTARRKECQRRAVLDCYGLNIIPIPHLSALLRKGKEIKKSGIKFSLGRQVFCFFFPLFLAVLSLRENF